MILPSTCDKIIHLADRAIGADQVGSRDDFYEREQALHYALDCVEYREMALLAKRYLLLRAAQFGKGHEIWCSVGSDDELDERIDAELGTPPVT